MLSERDIYIKASRSYELVKSAILLFNGYLADGVAPSAPDYYKARNLLKGSRSFYEETLHEARKLLGPIPAYATADFEQWKARILESNKIVTRGRDLEELRAELANDDFLRAWMTEEEIGGYLQANFEAQRSGKRKLANIKVRMMLDVLSGLILQAEALQKAAQKKHQDAA
ncbi:MAG: hypothetical protein PHX45_11815 [Acidobacteriota bacterium]|nr:hypothetical protein [Acidobacteriota bacterium]